MLGAKELSPGPVGDWHQSATWDHSELERRADGGSGELLAVWHVSELRLVNTCGRGSIAVIIAGVIRAMKKMVRTRSQAMASYSSYSQYSRPPLFTKRWAWAVMPPCYIPTRLSTCRADSVLVHSIPFLFHSIPFHFPIPSSLLCMDSISGQWRNVWRWAKPDGMEWNGMEWNGMEWNGTGGGRHKLV